MLERILDNLVGRMASYRRRQALKAASKELARKLRAEQQTLLLRVRIRG